MKDDDFVIDEDDYVEEKGQALKRSRDESVDSEETPKSKRQRTGKD